MSQTRRGQTKRDTTQAHCNECGHSTNHDLITADRKEYEASDKAGYLSTRYAGSLDSILQAGHAAVHRGWEPTEADIATLLDITETVIATAYVHEERAQALEKRVPKRGKPK